MTAPSPSERSDAQDSDELFSATFEHAAVGIANVATDGRFLRVNDSLCELLGLPREKLLQSSFDDITLEEDRDASEAARLALLTGTITRHSVEKRYRRGDGRVIWAELVTTLLRLPDGAPRYFISVFSDLTSRREAEVRRREIEDRYQSLFDGSLNAVYLCDLEGRFLDANPAALDLLGYSREEVRSVDFSSLLTSREDLARALESIRELLRTGADSEVSEYALRTKAGEIIWVEVLSSLVYREGQPVAVQGIARDVTERKMSAAALAASEAQFRVIFEQAGIGLAIVGCGDGTLQRCNEALAQMLGYGVDELTGMTVEDVSHPDDYKADRSNWDRMVEGTLPRFQMEKRYRRKDGRWMWGLLTSTLVRDTSGEPRFIIGMVEDISERKRVEEALRGAKETLQTIFDAAPVAILGLALDGTVTAWNAGATRMFGWTAEEAAGCFCPTVPADGVEDFRSMIQRVSRCGPENDVAYERVTKSGKRLQVSVSAGPLRDDHGSATGVMVVLEDVAERKYHEQLRRVESLGQVTANIAHEFNNMLMGIQPFAELIRRRSSDPDVKEWISRIEKSVARGRNVTDEILRFTRGLEPVKVTVAVQDWLHAFRGEGEALLEGTRHLSIDIPSEQVFILADVSQLNQVLCNLLINARDASAPGTTIRIRTFLSPASDEEGAGQLHVVVEDEGTGMDQSVLARIFDPLFTTKRGGTGLGLPICHQVATAHGGRIFAESTPGAGTAIHIILPTTPKPAAQPGTSRRDLKRPKHVLIVDDEESAATGIRELLDLEGVRTSVVDNGSDVVVAIRQHDPEVVLLDVGLPDIDGVDVCRSILALWPFRRVVFMTGHLGKDAVDEFLRLPNVGLLQKPFNIDELLAALDTVSREHPAH